MNKTESALKELAFWWVKADSKCNRSAIWHLREVASALDRNKEGEGCRFRVSGKVY